MISVYHSSAASGDETFKVGNELVAYLTGGRCGELKGVCGEGELSIERGQSSEAACWTVSAGTQFLRSRCKWLSPGEVDGRRRLPGRILMEVTYAKRNATTFGNYDALST